MNADSRSGDYSVEEVDSLIDLFLTYHNKIKYKSEELSVAIEELKMKNEIFTPKIKDLENDLIVLEHKKARLESELLIEITTRTELLNSICLTKYQLKEVKSLLRTSCIKNSKLEKELCNVFTVNDIQVEFQLVMKELDGLLNSWNNKSDLNDFVDTLLVNKQLITCVNIAMNLDSQSNLMNLLNKLREKLKFYDREKSVLKETVLELKNHIQLLENETSEIKSSVSRLSSEVQDVKDIRIKELEVKFELVVNENLGLQNKIKEIENKNIYLSESLHNVNNQLEEKNKLIVIEKFGENKSENNDGYTCSKCKSLFHLHKNPVDSCYCYFNEKVKELDKLKEMMAFEVTSLSIEENQSSILSQSAEDIFVKLMQNIIKKEEEITTSLQKQFKSNLEKAQEKAESSKNKRKSQESWIIVLQNENETMSKDLICLKEKSTSLERELKNCSIKLNSANAEIYVLKSKILELNTDNNMLLESNEKLLSYLKSEKESGSCLQDKLKKLNERLSIEELIVQDLQPNVNMKEECSQMSSHSQEMEKFAEEEKRALEMLRAEIKEVKEGSLEKDFVINNLKNAVSNGESKIKEQDQEIKRCLSKINSMVEEVAYLENEVRILTDQILGLNNIISDGDTNIPVATSNGTSIPVAASRVSNLVVCLRQELKQSFKNKSIVAELVEGIRFFESQCSLLVSYVKDLENKNLCTDEKNTSLRDKVRALKKDLTITKNSVDEAHTFLNGIILNIPCKVSSIKQAMEVAKQIFFEYENLKEKERQVFEKQKVDQDRIEQQLKEIRSLEKHNSNLKLQLQIYENDIRKLRSELRNLRTQWQKERTRVMTNEREIQTEELCCCRKYQDQVLKLEGIAEARSIEITTLKLEMMNENLPYKKKVSELECALLQAKERIKDLRFKLTESKNFAKDMIESYNRKLEDSQTEANKESATICPSQKYNNRNC